MDTSTPYCFFLWLLLLSLPAVVDCLVSPIPMAASVSDKLAALGITLKDPSPPKGNYVACVRSGNLLFLCGHLPVREDGTLVTGTLGKGLTVEQGYASARYSAISILGTLNKELDGDWDRLIRVVKVVGFVNSAQDFTQQPAVINGASDLLGAVLEGRGVHARTAVGSNVLPLGVATEVECIVEISTE